MKKRIRLRKEIVMFVNVLAMIVLFQMMTNITCLLNAMIAFVCMMTIFLQPYIVAFIEDTFQEILEERGEL